jgi:hypothetical protein
MLHCSKQSLVLTFCEVTVFAVLVHGRRSYQRIKIAMTDFTVQSGNANSFIASLRSGLGLAVAGLVALPANLVAANSVARSMEAGQRPSAHDIRTLGLPADFYDRIS